MNPSSTASPAPDFDVEEDPTDENPGDYGDEEDDYDYDPDHLNTALPVSASTI